MTPKPGALVLAAALLLSGGLPARAARLPDWVAAAAARPVPAWVGSAGVLRLHDEEAITVLASDRVRVVCRGAVRVLSPTGIHEAQHSVPYQKGSDEVRSLSAWTIARNGEVTESGRRNATDRTLAGPFSLYSEGHSLTLSAVDATTGTVFAWESEVEMGCLVAQWRFAFQKESPALLARVSLTLPKGLEPNVRWFGADSTEDVRQGQTWTWERQEVRPLPDEPLAPAACWDCSGIALDLSATADRPLPGATFADWPAVSRWLQALAEPVASGDASVAARAAALTGGFTDPVERLRRLARDVQRLNYVGIEMGLSSGAGYRPHPPADVLRLGYGDCKDKANLFCALVRAAGAQAWLMAVSTNGRDAVSEVWPSPMQFNHCIAAVAVPRGTTLPAVFEHPALGTLLAFDPTDPLTVFGALPAHEQGALVLPETPEGSALVQLPVAPPESDRQTRYIDAALDQDGNLTAELHEVSIGQAAVAGRAFRGAASDPEYRRALEAWLPAGGSSVELRRVHTTTDSVSGDFRLDVEYTVPRLGRALPGRLVLRPALVSPREPLVLPDSARVCPIALTGRCEAETVSVALPDGFRGEEIPPAVHDYRDFAALDADWSIENGRLRFVRTWTVRRITLAPARCREVRGLWARYLATTHAVVVLTSR